MSSDFGLEEKLRISVLFIVRCWEDQTGVKKLFNDLSTQGVSTAAVDAVKKLVADLRAAKAKQDQNKGAFDQIMSVASVLAVNEGFIGRKVRNVAICGAKLCGWSYRT